MPYLLLTPLLHACPPAPPAAAAEGKPIPTELRKDEAQLRKEVELEDDNTAVQRTHVDDEYAHAGEADPKVLITTSRDPSSRLTQFAKVECVCVWVGGEWPQQPPHKGRVCVCGGGVSGPSSRLTQFAKVECVGVCGGVSGPSSRLTQFAKVERVWWGGRSAAAHTVCQGRVCGCVRVCVCSPSGAWVGEWVSSASCACALRSMGGWVGGWAQ